MNRCCAHCGIPHRQYSLFDITREREGMRMLCHPCVLGGWHFDSDGIARHDPGRVVDGGARRIAAALVRGSVGTRKEGRG